MAVSAAFPTLADQFFKAAGMDAPQTCRKVFEFEAAALPHPIRSRRSVERYIMGTYGFKGRSAGLTAGADASLVVPGIKGPLRLPAASEPSLEDDASSEDALIVPKPVEEPLRIVGSPPEESEDTVADLSEYDGVGGPLALPSMVSEPTLVSILLPANASQPSDGGLSAIDRVFVVLLHPQDKFVTYSCGLSRSILV